MMSSTEENAPHPGDAEQVRIAYEMYLNGEPLNARGIPQLLAAFSKTPPQVSNIVVDIENLAELFIVMHEIAHIQPGMDGIDISGITISPAWNIPERRIKFWKREFRADLEGLYFLLSGCVEKVAARLEKVEAQGFAVETTFAAAVVSLKVLQMIERARFSGILDSDPVTSNIYAHHPPVECRLEVLHQWCEIQALDWNIPHPWGRIECLSTPARMLFEFAAKQYPQLLGVTP